MPDTFPALTLRPGQSRLINASEGFRLEVRSGCLWLTRPGDPADHFLAAGATIDLHENNVLIQSDQHSGASGPSPARYALAPLPAPEPRRGTPGGYANFLRTVLLRLGAGRLQQG